MAEIVIGLLRPVIELGKCIVAPIKRQFIYLCCLSSNADSLDKQANKLEVVRDGVQRDVETAERDAQVIDAQVKTWLDEVKEIQLEKSELDTQFNNIREGGCLFVKSRYLASRRAVKTAAAMKKKREDRREITAIFHRPEPASVVLDIFERPHTNEFESKKIEDNLMASLTDENVMTMGICGMGGVGKTTMAHKIKNRVMKEGVFGECVMVVVSQPADMEKIQGDIADQLGLKLKERSLLSRAQRLGKRLSGGKRILIILDDVWKPIKLEEIGIACAFGPEGCTILLTSRVRSVFTSMDISESNIFEMHILNEEEAWCLFKKKLGTCVDSQNQLSSLARDIANECKGLPLALASVAAVLKDEKKISVWRSSLQQLRSSNPEDLSDILEDVYTPLKLSYDYLSSQNAKSMFLLCSLFPEDYIIHLADLTAYAMGLCLFQGVRDLEQVRDRTETIVGMLKSRFLLLEGRYEDTVRMHDVVRDVAIFIASNETRLIKCGYNSTWISPFVGGERIEFSQGLTFPNLRLLAIEELGDEELKISSISLEGMKELNVLSINNIYSLTSLALTTQNLRTLILDNCESLKTISVVGELLNLEVLVCSDCNAIEEFPSEVLTSLRLLAISSCQSLERIGSAGVYQNFGHQGRPIKITLPKLERLELCNLPNLTVFYQEIESIEFPILECQQLKCLVSSSHGNYMGDDDDDDDHSLDLMCKQKVSFGNFMRILLLSEITNCGNVILSQITIGSFIHLVELTIEYCHDTESLLSFSIAQNLASLKLLRIKGCKEMVKVIGEECLGETTLLFPHLDELSLINLPKLKDFCNSTLGFPLLTQLEIRGCPQLKHLVSTSRGIRMGDDGDDHSLHLLCKQKVSIGNLMKQLLIDGITACDNVFCSQIPTGSFTHLEDLTIKDCDNIKSLFSFSIAQNLERLKLLKITRCREMVRVIEEENEECSREKILVFPHLEELHLCDLPKLKIFCNSALGLPKLIEMNIFYCFKMSGFDLGSITNLESLESLHISVCLMMKHVFLWSEKESEKDIIGRSSSSDITFPKLRTLTLYCLDELTNIYNGVDSFEQPFQTKVSIDDCPNLKWNVSAISGDINNKASFDISRKLQLRGGTNFKSILCSQFPSGSFIQLEELAIEGCSNIESLFSFSVARNLKSLQLLTIKNCTEMVKVIEEAEEESSHATTLLFPHLRELALHDLYKLKTFCDSALGLPKLVKLDIHGCHEMGGFKLGSLTTPILESLEILKVWRCRRMEYIFFWSTQEENEKEIFGKKSGPHPPTITFPKLKIMHLFDIDLSNIYLGVESIEFPLLTQMDISYCSNLKNLFSATSTCLSSGDINNKVVGKQKERTVHYSFSIWDLNPMGSYTRLEKLSISDSYTEISSLFSSSVAVDLINLKELAITRCNNMVKVIEEEEYSHETTLLFPNLEVLFLYDLPKLKFFCGWRCALMLPSLRRMDFGVCPKMERFSLGSLITPNLKNVKTNHGRNVIAVSGDLNDVLQKRFTGGQVDMEEEDEIDEEEESTSSEDSVDHSEEQTDERVEEEEESTSGEENED